MSASWIPQFPRMAPSICIIIDGVITTPSCYFPNPILSTIRTYFLTFTFFCHSHFYCDNNPRTVMKTWELKKNVFFPDIVSAIRTESFRTNWERTQPSLQIWANLCLLWSLTGPPRIGSWSRVKYCKVPKWSTWAGDPLRSAYTAAEDHSTALRTGRAHAIWSVDCLRPISPSPACNALTAATAAAVTAQVQVSWRSPLPKSELNDNLFPKN